MESAFTTAVMRSDMGPFDYHNKLIELAWDAATDGSQSPTDALRRFRVMYRHMAATVDGAAAELGFGPFGPMTSAMPGMQMPDTTKFLTATEQELDALSG
jgi:hypothetical protein